jgi:hypothetical protein
MAPAAALTGEARSRTLYFLSRPKEWPVWPFLPMVRRPLGAEEELGVVFDALGVCGLTGYSSTVLLTNVFALPPRLDDLLALPRQVFDTHEEVANAGWGVD